MAKDVDRHAWLKPALAERGHRQKDVAKAWGVDDAVVSRFIKSGEPELTFDRAQSLSRMLGIDLEELTLRLQEGLAPSRRPSRAARERAPGEHAAPTPTIEHTNGAVEASMTRLNEAVLDAMRALGVRNIKVVLDYGDIPPKGV